MPIVFISYSHKDLAFAEALQDTLNIVGYTTWRDRARLTGGLKFTDEIARGIEDCSIFLPLFSTDYSASPICQKELAYAQEKGRYIFAVVLDGAAPSHLHLLHQIRLKCKDKSRVPATALAQTLKELHAVIGNSDSAENRFTDGSDYEWPEEDLRLNLTNTRWTWCENADFTGDKWIEFHPAHQVTRSWARHQPGYWEVLKNGLVRFGPHVLYFDVLQFDLENGFFQAANGDFRSASPPERSGRFLNRLSAQGSLD